MADDLKYWLALNRVPGLGPVRLKKLLAQYTSARAICAALNCAVPDLNSELARLRDLNARAVTLDDRAYPESLKNIHDPPPVLYVKGDLRAEDKNAVAIVGTRNATRSGLESAARLASQLVQYGITIVSGLALGIDGAAHEGALRAGGRTIAVLGSGLDRITPASHLGLADRITANGAVVSEFALGREPDKWTFPQRNRVISGLSLGVIVVEGHYDSGAMITAKQALEQGREVFAVPGSVELPQSKGPHWLIKQGAKLVEDAQDVIDELKFQLPTSNFQTNPKSQIPKTKPANLTPEEEKIYDVLTAEPQHLDAVALASGLPLPLASGLLLMMELKQLVRQLPGKMFSAVN